MNIEEYSKKNPLKTPVLFLIFNRPDCTQKVFNEIRKAKPKQLFIAADGPRENISKDKEKCKKTREIVKNIDWDCEVKTLFRDKNLGCKYAVSGAIDWFFENVEEGIILEDDCLPSQSFFWFCQDLLRRYRNDNRVMHIGGHYHLNKKTKFYNYSYFFSIYTPIWGWATWKRAWKEYDVEIKTYPQFKKEKQIKNIFKRKISQKNREKILDKVYRGAIDTWDYQWDYSLRINNRLAIRPTTNLVENIGFNKDATHTSHNSKIIKKDEINFPLNHPIFFIENVEEDKKLSKKIIDKFSIQKIVKNILKKCISKNYLTF